MAAVTMSFDQTRELILASVAHAKAGLHHDGPRNAAPGAVAAHFLVASKIAAEYLPWAALHADLTACGPLDDVSGWPQRAKADFMAIVEAHVRAAQDRVARRRDPVDPIQPRSLSRPLRDGDVHDIQAFAIELLHDAGDQRFIDLLAA